MVDFTHQPNHSPGQYVGILSPVWLPNAKIQHSLTVFLLCSCSCSHPSPTNLAKISVVFIQPSEKSRWKQAMPTAGRFPQQQTVTTRVARSPRPYGWVLQRPAWISVHPAEAWACTWRREGVCLLWSAASCLQSNDRCVWKLCHPKILWIWLAPAERSPCGEAVWSCSSSGCPHIWLQSGPESNRECTTTTPGQCPPIPCHNLMSTHVAT